MGLKPNRQDPCLYTGFLTDPTDPHSLPLTVPLTIGLYVDDFVYFPESDEVEQRFEKILKDQVVVDFMGTVEWFLGIHFAWKNCSDGHLSVYLNQSGFAANLVKRFGYHHRAPSPLATPYQAGYPVDAILSSPPLDDMTGLRKIVTIVI